MNFISIFRFMLGFSSFNTKTDGQYAWFDLCVDSQVKGFSLRKN